MIFKELINGLLPNVLFIAITIVYFILRYISTISYINSPDNSLESLEDALKLEEAEQQAQQAQEAQEAQEEQQYGAISVISILISKLNFIRQCGGKSIFTLLFPLLYLGVIFIIGVIINFGMNANRCENVIKNLFKISMYVAIPLATILFPIMCLVYKIKKWKAPFSNTSGLLFSVVFQDATNIVKQVNNLIGASHVKPPFNVEDLPYDEIKLDNRELDAIRAKYGGEDDDELKMRELTKNFYKILIARDLIGEMWWYILGGLLSSVITYSLVSNIKCKYTENKIREDEDEMRELMGES